MTTTTIQVFEDVKARLEEERKDKKESFNDILRRVLDMNEPQDHFKDKIPDEYKATITEDWFVNNESKNWAFLESLNMSDDEKQDLISGNFGIDTKINGVSVRFSLNSILTLDLEAKTQDELIQQIEKLKEKLPFKLDDDKIETWSCYHCSEKQLKEMAKKEVIK